MSFDAPHIGYVLMSYGLSAAIIVGLIAAYVVRSRQVESRLSELEASGVPRRKSAGTTKR